MSVQTIVLKQFNELYPQAKLREISEKTGIQITRVFRILNGAEMKVSELESFQKATDTSKSPLRFLKLSKDCAMTLSPERRKYLQGLMEQALKVQSFQTKPQLTVSEVQHEL